MLVFELLAPPVTKTLPSESMLIPGQNISCPVSETSRSVADDVAGSKKAVYVLPRSTAGPVNRSADDQTSTFPSGKLAAATGTRGKLITPLHLMLIVLVSCATAASGARATGANTRPKIKCQRIRTGPLT